MNAPLSHVDTVLEARSQATPLVRFESVSKTYDGENLVVQDLNLEIQRGEFLTLLGPSGSGKTTTLMMLAGFETPTGGRILLDGRLLDRVPPYRRDFGVVFQNYALFPHLTVAENIGYPLKVRGMSRAERSPRVATALETVRLTGFDDRRPAQLSGGQQQRVALARALVFDPKLVLMDEPLGALDKKLREQMQLEIKQIHDRLGVTVVYVTHDQVEALTMSDRIAVFHEGVIRQIGTPDEIYARPTSSFVANFIGENNRLSGRVESLHGEDCLVALDGGGRVRALAVRIEGVGSRTTLSIRPEKVKVGATTGSLNRFDAEVLEIIYLGDHRRVRVGVADSDQFVLRLPEEMGCRRGQALSLSWDTVDCRALDPEPTRAEPGPTGLAVG
jgi:putative spermidine/putrescine transport system ATP-binding protein